MAEIAEKHQKRIGDLIKSKNAAVALLVVGLILPPLGLLLILVGGLYGVEVTRFLRKYPEMDSEQAVALRSARKVYLAMSGVHFALWLVIAAVFTAILLKG